MRKRIDLGGAISTATLGPVLSGEEMNLLIRILDKPEVLARGDQALRDYIRKINEQKEIRQQGDDLLALQKRMKETKGYRG